MPTASVDPFLAHESVLVVTAHPDDECMFFTPTLLALYHRGVKVYLLCLSTGNAEGQGSQRIVELYRAARTLGIPKDRIAIVDHPKLSDGGNWSSSFIEDQVIQAVNLIKATHIITFDLDGVSGHPNHRIIAASLKYLESILSQIVFYSEKNH
jgi:N-acetylglucosaminylphosphatidylinositol deacetylase